jgi:hypothetical protein
MMAKNLPDEDWMDVSFENDPFERAENEGYLADESNARKPDMDDGSKRRGEPVLSKMSIADLKSRLLVSESSDDEEDSTTERDFEQMQDEYIKKHGVPPPLPAVLADEC